MATEIPLGPPDRTRQQIVGGVFGIPIGLGIVMPHHALLLGAGCGGFLAYHAGVAIHSVREFRRFATENNVAVAALGRGEHANAYAVFARWSTAMHPWAAAVARHNVGSTLLAQGKLEDAAQILEDAVQHRRKPLSRIGLLPATVLDIALCHALLGKLDVAKTWCSQADQPVKGPPRPALPASKVLVRAIIDCREGRAPDAAAALEQAVREHEAVVTGSTLRIMRVVRAFAAADGPRNQGVVERILADMTPRFAGEFHYLGVAWPEMAAFLAAHRLD